MSKVSVETDTEASGNIPGFLAKTYEIFSSPNYRYCCEWSPDGTTIIITKIEEFSKQVLPKYFKHSHFQSFVRQLNMYDFHKLVQDPNNGEFAHKDFLRDHPEKLVLIKRKANHRTSKTEPATPIFNDDMLEAKFGLKGEDFAQEADLLMHELVHQKQTRDNFEKRLKETEIKLKSMTELQAKQSYLEGENMLLKQMILDSRSKQAHMQEKMERVLGLLYSAFVSTGGALGGNPRAGALENGEAGHFLAIKDGSPDVISEIFKEFTTDSGKQIDLSLSRLNSLRSDLDIPLFSSDATDARSFLSSDLEDGSHSLKYLQNQNGAAGSAAFQGKALCRLHSFDDSHIIDGVTESSRVETIFDGNAEMSPKRMKLSDSIEGIDNVNPQEQMELDLLRRNQDVTLGRIDSLESSISNLLDFIDEFDDPLLKSSEYQDDFRPLS
jgi:hypothetical protein